jgi:hypothetical protein
VVTGCFAPDPQPGLPCSANRDCPAPLVCGADDRCVLPGTGADAAVDAPETIDAPPVIDAPPTIDACPGCRTEVAGYRFESAFSDETGEHHGIENGNLAFVPGRTGAGQAVHVPMAGGAWLHVPDSPEFDIASGMVELWFRIGPDAPAGVYLGLISRDASETATGGHFNIRVGHDRRIVARIQMMSDPTIQTYRCTANPVADTGWHHFEVEFGAGGLELRLDGATATGTSWTDLDGTPRSCTDAWTLGIAGNDNPWVIGGLTSSSSEGTGLPVSDVGADVDFDDVIIWTD